MMELRPEDLMMRPTRVTPARGQGLFAHGNAYCLTGNAICLLCKYPCSMGGLMGGLMGVPLKGKILCTQKAIVTQLC